MATIECLTYLSTMLRIDTKAWQFQNNSYQNTPCSPLASLPQPFYALFCKIRKQQGDMTKYVMPPMNRLNLPAVSRVKNQVRVEDAHASAKPATSAPPNTSPRRGFWAAAG